MKIGFVGTANCGKTTVVKEIERLNIYKNHNIIHEIAGHYSVADRQKLSTQLAIMERQISAENKCHNFISDRTVIDNCAYFLWHYRKLESKGAYSEIYKEYMVRLDRHLVTKPYDAIIYIDQYFPLEDNGIRDMDFEMQDWVFERLDNIVPLLCDVYKIPFYTVNGHTSARLEKIQELLKPLYIQSRIPDFC